MNLPTEHAPSLVYVPTGGILKKIISTRSKAWITVWLAEILCTFVIVINLQLSHSLIFLFVTSKHSSVALLSLLFGPVEKCLPFRKRTKHLFHLSSPLSHIIAHSIPYCLWSLVHHTELISTLSYLCLCLIMLLKWTKILTTILPLSYNSWDWAGGWHHIHPRTLTVQLFAIPHSDSWTDKGTVKHQHIWSCMHVTAAVQDPAAHLDTMEHVISQWDGR